MRKVTSKDGTTIAYENRGSGPALILIDGALTYRSFGPMPKLADLFHCILQCIHTTGAVAGKAVIPSLTRSIARSKISMR
jgi:hypothetical protein